MVGEGRRRGCIPLLLSVPNCEWCGRGEELERCNFITGLGLGSILKRDEAKWEIINE